MGRQPHRRRGESGEDSEGQVRNEDRELDDGALARAGRRGAGLELPGRMELVHGEPMLVLDSAHNPDGARALAEALPEVVGTKAGLRVRAGDVGELTAALALVLDSPGLGEQLGRAGRRRVLESYTWRATAQRTADWYADVLDRRAAGC